MITATVTISNADITTRYSPAADCEYETDSASLTISYLAHPSSLTIEFSSQADIERMSEALEELSQRLYRARREAAGVDRQPSEGYSK